MQKFGLLVILLIFAVIIVTGCSSNVGQGKMQNVGMLLETSISDQVWAEKGYQGLNEIGETFDTDVYYKENIKTEAEVIKAVDEFVQHGVNLVFGHSSIYGKYFTDIAKNYPDLHFVYFNGGYFSDNVTSFNFNAHAMGFFAGVLSGAMTETDKVGIVAAYEWQPEIEGFFEGVKYQNPQAAVQLEFLNDWNDTQTATQIYQTMKHEGTDVFYPTGDAYSAEIIERAKQDGNYAIGYVTDQSAVGRKTVLTSTIQHVDKLYHYAAEQFNDGELEGDIKTFDFQDDAISLAPFSSDIPIAIQKQLKQMVDAYTETGLLPHEQ